MTSVSGTSSQGGNAHYGGDHDVLISGTGTDGNVVAGNFIGTDATGTIALANAW